MINVILCGGGGTRMWPLSREKLPKQFIPSLNPHIQSSYLQATAVGNEQISRKFLIVCNAEHFWLAREHLKQAGVEERAESFQYLLEPIPRNTAAAICLASMSIDPEEIALFIPSDHHIEYTQKYANSILRAQELAKQDEIVLFGIKPFHPETGYGYIEADDSQNVKRFHEKPSEELALQYIQHNNFYWNSGMLCAKARVLLQAIERHAPDIFIACKEAYQNSHRDPSVPFAIRIDENDMRHIPSISIDYALLEKMTNLKCIGADFSWSDLGSFDALYNIMEKDADGNAKASQNIIAIDSHNNLVIGRDKMIAVIDIENLVVVDTPDALLIAQRGSTQKVRDVVNLLKQSDSDIYKVHNEEIRPWGSFTVLESTESYKVKRIVVFPGKRLSLQKHQFRAEHWVVIEGTAYVTLGSENREVTPNHSIFIPLGETHRIENRGTANLVIIEVQYGSYTGEDDIIRLQDDFDRIEGSKIIKYG